jgi:hypothetical protein
MTIRTKANTKSIVMEILRPIAGISSYISLAWSSKKPDDINTRFLFLGLVLTKITSLSIGLVWVLNLVSHIKGGTRIEGVRFENITAVTSKFTLF